jgi:TonB family protein
VRLRTRAVLTLAVALMAATGCSVQGRKGRGPDMAVFVAYRQQVMTTVKAKWSPGPTTPPGLASIVLFEIDPDGTVGNVQVWRSSGDAAYDAAALRAVTLASPLAPPPARYADLFRRFSIEFRSDQP